MISFFGVILVIFLLVVFIPGNAVHAQEGSVSAPDQKTDIQQNEFQSEFQNEVDELEKKRKQLEEQERELTQTLREQAGRLLQQRDAMEEQTRLIRQQKELLEEQQRKIESLRIQMDELVLPAAVEEEKDVTRERRITQERQITEEQRAATEPPAPEQPGTDTTGNQGQTGPVGQAPPPQPERPRQAVDVIEDRGVLTHKGTLIIEPSLNYSYSSVTRVALEGFTIIPALTIGAIDVRAVDRNTAVGALGFRYGFTNHFEVGLRIPYVSRDDTTISRPLAVATDQDTVTKADGSGLGDVEMTFNYMFNNGKGGGPFYVGSLRAKSRSGTDPFETEVDPETGLQTTLPTGTGFVSVQPGLSISFPSDPAVFYGGLSYLHNIGREISPATGLIEPGDAVGFSFGMALAINPRASFSLGYSHNSVAETRQNGEILPGSTRLQVGALLMGLSHRVGKRRNFNMSVGAGLTEDAPDVQVAFRMPFAFSLFGDK